MSKKDERIQFPDIAIYRRNANRQYAFTDFADGAVITYYCSAGKSEQIANGLAWYTGRSELGTIEIRLVNVLTDIEPYINTEDT